MPAHVPYIERILKEAAVFGLCNINRFFSIADKVVGVVFLHTSLGITIPSLPWFPDHESLNTLLGKPFFLFDGFLNDFDSN